ncbi:MAG: WYL domain-containing protein [Treponema sp.]|nr:WYL domain-containing protein [Treponema sp.]
MNYSNQHEKELNERCIEMLLILREAPEHPDIKYNSKYFEKYFHKSNVTILRDARILKDHELIESKHHQYILKKGFDDEILSSDTKKQIVLIAGIKGLLQQYKDTPLFKNIEKLFYFIVPKIAKSSGLLSSARIAVPPQMEFKINEGNWSKILFAMEQNRKIKTRYAAPYKNSGIRRTLWPYQILLDNGTVYLFAHHEEKNKDLLYDFNKLEGITITNEEFELPDDYDFTKRCKGGRLGAFSSDKVENYEIEVTGYASYWIKDHKWADDQTFEELDEEDVIIRFSSCQFAKVKELVLSLGSGAKPLAPKRLVNEWKKEVTAMYENMNR